MTGHALLIGVPDAPDLEDSVEHRDVRSMKSLLETCELEVETLVGHSATRDGIRDAYRRLIERVPRGAAAVVYYTGHGGLALDGGTSAPEFPRMVQYIVPSDFARTTETDFFGISSWELSLLLDDLTQATPNVTVIFDCCHAALMSRGPALTETAPRAQARPTRVNIRRHFATLRERYGELRRASPEGNPSAVRIFACRVGESAFPTQCPDGLMRGALTYGLVSALAPLGDLRRAQVSWQTVDVAVRERVRWRVPSQTPIIDGPIRRRLFQLVEAEGAAIPVHLGEGGLRLEAGRLAGVSVGDVYSIGRPGAGGTAPAHEIARASVSYVAGLHAIAQPDRELAPASLPVDAFAWPYELALPRSPVRVVASADEQQRLEVELEGVERLRSAEGDEEPIGVLYKRGAEIEVRHGDGAKILPASGAWTLESALHQLRVLAAAQTLIELQGEGLPAEEIEVDWGTFHDGEPIARPPHGAAIGRGDRFFVRVRNRAKQVRYAQIFSIGLCGTISRFVRGLNGIIPLEPLSEYVLDRHRPGAPGIGLRWPACMPTGEPRSERVVVIVTTRPIDLRALETHEQCARGALFGGSALQRLVAQLHDGGTRSFDTLEQDPFLVVHRSWMLHSLAAKVARRRFATDEDPAGTHGVSAPEAWRGGAAAAREIEIRIRDGAAERAVRLDSLVCTRSADGRRVYEARTLRIAAGAAVGEAVLWRGAVRDLVEVYLWAAPDLGDTRELAALMAAAKESPERAAWIAEAIEALVISDEQAPWALAAGACAALANIAEEELRRSAPEVAGLVHASFVAAEGYGVGRGRRYAGLGVALSLEIEERAGPGAG